MIVGFGLFSFREDSVQQAMKLLRERLKLEKKRKGILEGYIARGLDDPGSLLIYTKWDSWESRKGMFKSLATSAESEGLSSEIMKLSNREPVFGTFEVAK